MCHCICDARCGRVISKWARQGLTWTLPTMDTLGLMGALGLNVAALGRA